MSRHHIIRDPGLFSEFVEWLPDLNHNECYYLTLQARRKYSPSILSSDAPQLTRFVATRRNLATKVAQLECPIGAYCTRDETSVPDEALALYLTPNPRCMRKATYASAQAMLTSLQNSEQQPTIKLKPHSEALTQIHKARSRSVFVHFDVDLVTGDNSSDVNAPKCGLSIDEIYKKTVEFVGRQAANIIVTRGGCHILIETAKVAGTVRNWHPRIVEEFNVDQTGDLMIPVVGCRQGDFVPHFYVDQKDSETVNEG